MKPYDLDYFKGVLVNFLDDNHPLMSGDEKLIRARSRAALSTFNELEGKGVDTRVALEMATLELTDGLRFSLYKFLLNLISEDFDEIPVDKRKDFCLRILPECKKIAESVSCQAADDHDDDFAFYRLETGLTRVIKRNMKWRKGSYFRKYQRKEKLMVCK